MNRTFFIKATAVATLTVAGLAGSSTAARAQDVLNFTGNASVSDQPGNPNNLLIDFLANGTTAGTPTGTVSAIQTIGGVFTGISVGTQGTITDLIASSAGFVGLPVSPLLVIGSGANQYTFTLTGSPAGNTFGPISLFDIGVGTSANFGVTGTVAGG